MRSMIPRNLVCLSLMLFAAVPAVADELSDLMPADTLLYVGWPGTERLGDAWDSSALSNMLENPEVVHCRAVIERTFDEIIAKEAGSDPEAAMFSEVLKTIGMMGRHPLAFGFFSAVMAADGPSADLALVVRAGEDGKAIAVSMDTLLEQIVKNDGNLEIEQVSVGDVVLNQIATPEAPDMPLRWGVMGDRFILTLGLKYYDFLEGGAAAAKLTSNERFAAAVRTTGAGAGTPTVFFDIEGLVAHPERLPLLTWLGFERDEGKNRLSKLMNDLGMGSLKSFSMAMKKDGDGIRTTWFLHAPDLEKGPLAAIWNQPALTDADLAVIPRDVRFAVAGSFDLKAAAEAFITAVEASSPGAHESVESWLASVEESTGLSLIDDVCGAFGRRWAYYDADDFGGFYITGLVLVAEPREGHDFNALADKLLKLADQKADVRLTRHSESYRDTTVQYVQFEQWPIPVFPCWAQVEGRLVIALYPQMLRPAIDQLLDQKPSIRENGDFARLMERMPPDIHAIQYMDTVTGVRGYYTFLMPIGQVLQAALRSEEGISSPPTAIPSLPAINRHLFGNLNATRKTADGIVGVSYGALPFGVPALGQGGMAGPMLLSIGLPSLVKARVVAKSTVSASNLRMLGVGMQMYAADHDGKLPPNLKTAIESVGGEPTVLIAPNDPNAPDDNADASYSSYEYLPGLSTDVENGWQMVVAYEREDFDGDNRINVLFLDSHVELMTMQRFEDRLAETKKYLESLKSESESAGLK